MGQCVRDIELIKLVKDNWDKFGGAEGLMKVLDCSRDELLKLECGHEDVDKALLQKFYELVLK